MKQSFYLCRRCGNLAVLLRDRGVPLFCCGEAMEELRDGVSGASGEKHLPVCRVEGDRIHVTVGAVEHPMDDDHYIEWIALESSRGIQIVHLRPGDRPEADFTLTAGDRMEGVYAFCNQHALWRK